MTGVQVAESRLICGTLNNFPFNVIRAQFEGEVISGDCPNDPGTLVGGMVIVQGFNNVVVENLRIVGNPYDPNRKGVALLDTSGTIVRKVKMVDLRYGIYTDRNYRADDITIEDNEIMDVAQGIAMHAYSGNLLSVKKGWTIRNNVIVGVYTKQDTLASDNEAIGVQGGKDLLIEGNFIRNARYGINIWACETAILDNVVIFRNALGLIRGGTISWPSRAIFKSCHPSDAHKDVRISANVIANTDDVGIRWYGGAQNVVISDNVLGGTKGIDVKGNITQEDNEVD